MELRFYAFWAINAALDEGRMFRQLGDMAREGFDGVVFHPRFYPNRPGYLGAEFLAILSRVILEARRLGLEFWIYDENGWPSGTVGGALLREHPEDVQLWVDLVDVEPSESICSFERGGKRRWVVRREGEGVDYLRPSLARHFVEMTYERYRTGLAAEAFAHVTTFFSDEPEFGLGHAVDRLSPLGAVPWTEELPALWRERWGDELADHLPAIFLGGDGEARVRFWELLTDRFCDAFVKPINAWCRSHGKTFTAHVKGEEHPLFQVPTSGSCSQVFRHLGLPGIDALERFPSGHFFPRQLATSAAQFGNGDCMAEAFGGAGWGATPGDFERFIGWLSGHGVNRFVVHLYQYELSSHAIRDWPPSIPNGLTWREVFPEVLRRCRERARGVDQSADTLVIAPCRAVMAEWEPSEFRGMNNHNGCGYRESAAGRINREFLEVLDRVHRSGMRYHVTDERTVEEFGERGAPGKLRVGQCEYGAVILGPEARLKFDVAGLVVDAPREEEIPVVAVAAAAVVGRARMGGAKVNVRGNVLALDPREVGAGMFEAEFAASGGAELRPLFADLPAEVELSVAREGVRRIRWRCLTEERRPIVAVAGEFNVVSLSAWRAGPRGVMAAEGPFAIEAGGRLDPTDLLRSGVPFGAEVVSVSAMIEVPAGARRMRAEVRADCARVSLRGVDLGWAWGPEWAWQVPVGAGGKRVEMEVRLVPSTFNRYGPHHHVEGDKHVVSPGQFEYVKNFADGTDVPASTRVSAWHFLPFGIGDIVEFG